jgi:hypothetical protein
MLTSMPLRAGHLVMSVQTAAIENPRQTWRGFSFGGYWFSYYYFSSASPSCAAGRLMPG